MLLKSMICTGDSPGTLFALNKSIINEFIQNSKISGILNSINSILQIHLKVIFSRTFNTFIFEYTSTPFYGIKYMYLFFSGNTSRHKMLG